LVKGVSGINTLFVAVTILLVVSPERNLVKNSLKEEVNSLRKGALLSKFSIVTKSIVFNVVFFDFSNSDFTRSAVSKRSLPKILLILEFITLEDIRPVLAPLTRDDSPTTLEDCENSNIPTRLKRYSHFHCFPSIKKSGEILEGKTSLVNSINIDSYNTEKIKIKGTPQDNVLDNQLLEVEKFVLSLTDAEAPGRM
jgi:hypothetical protein